MDVPGGRLFARRWISEADNISPPPPILLLHDSLGCVETWREFPRRLAQTLRTTVIAYDRLGFGKSTAREALPSFQFIEEEGIVFLPLIMKHFNFGKYLLFGHSVGGAMALEAAFRLPNIGAVVSESAQAFIEEKTILGILRSKQAFKDLDRLAKLRKFHGNKADWVLRAWTDIWTAPEFSAWGLETCLRNVKCPVLAIHGQNDEYGSSAFPQAIFDKVSGIAEILLIENCGHVPHREDPAKVLSALENFFKNHVIY
ncbi:MAG: alpha/beta hydrolase [Proteobacteria bacterium]|nr:MAG: alpha/beta hydrolase [Pseudomonadota bacterium]